jgi:hypothetical protein
MVLSPMKAEVLTTTDQTNGQGNQTYLNPDAGISPPNLSMQSSAAPTGELREFILSEDSV